MILLSVAGAQNSCTAGRAAFITGQYPIRSGMVTVGVPGDKLGLSEKSPNESYDNKDAAGHLEQRASWLFQPMSERVRAHLGTLIQYPPVQGGTSLDMNQAVEEALRQAKRE